MEENKYYVYRHVRLDTNVPFYIGIGTKHRNYLCHTNEFKRAYSKYKRSKFWYSVTSKTDYRVEIIFECSTREQAIEKEIEFISLYGRRDIGTGILVNMTSGGDGFSEVSDETRKKLSKASFKKWSNPEFIKKHSESTKRLWSNPEHLAKTKEIRKQTMSNPEVRNKIKNMVRELKGTLIVDKETGIFYTSLSEGCERLNLNYVQQKNFLRKKSKRSRFIRVDDDKEINDK